mmetsp:Transcript_26505/g.88786  ORF Transcript_26505/g.88786 Transcript_26505/m.88786 type:complete len:253 (-) Transcript_26505:218-976(-)
MGAGEQDVGLKSVAEDDPDVAYDLEGSQQTLLQRSPNASVSWQPVHKGAEAATGRLWKAAATAGRLLLLALVVALIGYLSRRSGLREHFSIEALRASLQGQGLRGRLVGLAIFVAAFCVGEIIQVPAPVFIWVSALAYGRWMGALYSYIGAVFAVLTSFLMVRSIGGQPIRKVAIPAFSRLMDMVEDRPVRAVALIWLLFWCVPWVNYVIAMSPVKLRDYFLGSVLGLIVPVGGLGLLFDTLMPLLQAVFGF